MQMENSNWSAGGSIFGQIEGCDWSAGGSIVWQMEGSDWMVSRRFYSGANGGL